MSYPIQKLQIETIDKKTKSVNTLFDSGSFYSIIKQVCLPSSEYIVYYPVPELWGTASEGGTLEITGSVELIVTINNKKIKELIYIAPNLSKEMIIGSKTLQAWHITIDNSNSKTIISVDKDMNDPDITSVV